MKIHIISVGKLDKNHNQLADEYRKMTSWKLLEHEITYSKKLSGLEKKLFEGKLMLEKGSLAGLKIALDESGKQLTSYEFSNIFKEAMMQGYDINFYIGGSDGLGDKVKDGSILLGLSNMTLPHKMAKLILIEQIYRAETIIRDHPYHKS